MMRHTFHRLTGNRFVRPPAADDPSANPFAVEGYVGPVDLFTPAQCALILRHVRYGTQAPLVEGGKDAATTDRFFYDLATRPAVLQLLAPIIGDNIVLWGTGIVEREPGSIHPWHTDIESSAPDGRCVLVWIGLEHTSRESALGFITRSHRFGKTIQQVVHEHGMRRGQATDQGVLGWARRLDSQAAFVQPDMTDGQAILLDGRVWHTSHNRRPAGKRTALLLQYAAVGTPLVAPDFSQLEWPFRMTDRRLPCILVHGNVQDGPALVVSAPAADPAIEPIATYAQSYPLPFAEDRGSRFRTHLFFRGATPTVDVMNCHMSVLSEGHSPHLPHAHVEEELLIVLDGEADIVLSEGPELEGARVERLRAGAFVYHPAYQHHTIRNSGSTPVHYLMYKWRAAPAEIDRPLGSQVFTTGDASEAVDAEPLAVRRLFEHPTAYLGKLHAHMSTLQPGAGYPPHSDGYDVAIVVLAGRVETLDRVVEPLGIVFYAAGQMHGMKSIGDIPARYLVFEFHPYPSLATPHE